MQIYEVIDDIDQPFIMVVMELVEGGPVQEENDESTERLSEPVARGIFRQLLLGLKYMHERGVIHGDVKPANLAFGANGIVKLIDFGSSVACKREWDEEQRRYVVHDELLKANGTPAFLPPEVCEGETYSGQQGDLWAAACTLFHLVFGDIPFGRKTGMTVFAMYDAIACDPLTIPEEPRISDELRDLLTRMLDKDRTKRMTLDEVLDHEWCNKDEWAGELGVAEATPEASEDMDQDTVSFETFSAAMAKVLQR